MTEATALVAYVNGYIDTCFAEIEAGAAEATLADKKKVSLSTEQLNEIALLCHFEYDYSKLYNTELTAYITYLRGEKIEAAYGEENTAAEIQLDFMQSSFTTHKENAWAVYEGVKAAVSGYISESDIANRLPNDYSSSTDEDKEEEEGFDKYAVEEGSIVIVTYGGKNGVDADAYKSIILNYNNFSVSIEYEGKVYTLPAYGYVVIMK